MIQRAEAPLGTRWFCEYAVWCLGHNLSVAGGIELAYRLGRAHDEFERINERTPAGHGRARARTG